MLRRKNMNYVKVDYSGLGNTDKREIFEVAYILYQSF